MSYFDDVMKFHRFFSHPTPKTPGLINRQRFQTRMGWTKDELVELQDAFDIGDLVGCADGIADAVYFLLGTAVEMGLPMNDIWNAVHKANMNKRFHPVHTASCTFEQGTCTCGTVQKSKEGKTVKPENWQPPEPDIHRILNEAKTRDICPHDQKSCYVGDINNRHFRCGTVQCGSHAMPLKPADEDYERLAYEQFLREDVGE